MDVTGGRDGLHNRTVFEVHPSSVWAVNPSPFPVQRFSERPMGMVIGGSGEERPMLQEYPMLERSSKRTGERTN